MEHHNMDTNNSYGANARKSPIKGNASRREATQSRERPITVPREELSFYTELAINILKDVELMHCELLPIGDKTRLQKEYARDALEIRHRVACEGISFLTKTLPAYAKAIDIALATGAPVCISGFQEDPNSNLPRFLGQLLQLIFVAPPAPWGPKPGLAQGLLDYERYAEWFDRDGDKTPLLEDCSSEQTREMHFCRAAWVRTSDCPRNHTIMRMTPTVGSPLQSAHALRLVRQVCYSFYKLELPTDEKVAKKVLADFIATDAALPDSFESLGVEQENVLQMARGLVCRVLCTLDPRDIMPRHGPGAVATGEKSHQKARFARFYKQLNAFYPYDTYFFYNHSHLCDRLQEFQDMEVQDAGTAKVVLVPKDSRGPRLISCEPLEIQWIQQGLMKALVHHIESHPLTRGRVNFRDQGVNRRLAEICSRVSDYNNLVTLDMKEASDRVSLALVRELVPCEWYDALFACRSTATTLPDGTKVPLKKFAPMGSAVCFPVEALIFWALGVAASQTYLGRHVDAVVNLLKGETPSVDKLSHPSLFYVYGDDIICPGQFVPQVRTTYDAFSLKLNDQKCCVAGFFRESCGVDSYFGYPVTPTKYRRRWSCHYSPGSHISWVAYSNLMYNGGFAQSAAFIAKRINSLRRTPYVNTSVAKDGTVSVQSHGFVAFERPLSRAQEQYWNKPFRKRFNRRFQRMEILADVPTARFIKGEATGWEEMLRMATHKVAIPCIDLSSKLEDPELDLLGDPIQMLIKADEYSVRSRVKLKLRWMPLS